MGFGELATAAIAGLALGAFGWTFAEYALHNWYGHVAKGRNHFSREHLAHHARKDHFAPNSQKAAAALGAGLAVFPLAIQAAGPAAGLGFGLGFVSMYLAYEYVHWAAHKIAPRGAYSRWVRRNHFSHHFTSPRHNHGVTCGLWDRVFRTRRDPGLVRVPRRMAMVWLVDEHGDIKPEYASDYVLTGRVPATARQQAVAA
jgi:hypothetical protein